MKWPRILLKNGLKITFKLFTMINIRNILILSEEGKREQIRIRKELMEQMVGQLWPEVLQNEIDEIRSLL